MIKTLRLVQLIFAFFVAALSIGSVRCNAATYNEIWIALRTDGLAGSGTITDPYDGSTQPKFDAVMATVVTGTRIHLSPGTFHSNFSWRLQASTWLQGAGRNITTILNAGAYQGGPGITNAYPNADGVTVSDLTVDVNGSALTATTGGIGLYGNREAIQNVRVTRAVSPSTTECFPIAIFAAANPVVDALIDGCEVDNFIGTSGTMILIGIDSSNTNATVTGKIQHCYVHDCNAQAYGAGGALDLSIDGNYSYNCKSGFNLDSWTNTGLRLVNNQFMKCAQFGITINDQNATLKDTLVQDNVVEIDSGVSTDFIAYWITDTYVPAKHIDGLILRNNLAFSYATGSVRNANGFIIDVTSNLIGIGNESSAILANSLTVDSGGPVLFNNTNIDTTPMYSNDASSSSRTLVPGNIVAGGPLIIRPSSMPLAPTSGITLWVSSSDGKLHAEDSSGSDGTVVTVPNPPGVP